MPEWRNTFSTDQRGYSVSPDQRQDTFSPEEWTDIVSRDQRWGAFTPYQIWDTVSPEERMDTVPPDHRWGRVSPEKDRINSLKTRCGIHSLQTFFPEEKGTETSQPRAEVQCLIIMMNTASPDQRWNTVLPERDRMQGLRIRVRLQRKNTVSPC